MMGEWICVMATRCKLFLTVAAVLLLAADGSGAKAADLAAGSKLRPFAAPGKERATNPTADAPEVTGTVHARPTQAGQAPAAHARAARERFDEARAAMERGLLLRGAAPKTNIAVLETAVRDLSHHLSIVEQTAQLRSTGSIPKAIGLVQDWYEAGLKIIKPPAEGIVELPLPMNVRSKADAVVAVLDQVAAEAGASAPRSVRPSKRRAYSRSRPVASDAPPRLASAPAW
jgi:hypothetical protein